jgi:hypothetical protein
MRLSTPDPSAAAEACALRHERPSTAQFSSNQSRCVLLMRVAVHSKTVAEKSHVGAYEREGVESR